MREDHGGQTRPVDQVLEEIQYGLASVEETRERLLGIVEKALSGPEVRDEDREKAALCISLLEKLDSGMADENLERGLDAVARAHGAYKRRKRNLMRAFASAAAALFLFAGLSALKVLPPIPGLFKASTGVESADFAKAALVSPQTVADAVAAHQRSGSLFFSAETKDALAAFLGFDPKVPETIDGAYQAAAYSALIAPGGIRIRCAYRAIDGAADGMVLKQYLYTDSWNVHTLWEEDVPGQTQFTWTEGNAIFQLAADDGTTLPESVVTRLLPREAAS